MQPTSNFVPLYRTDRRDGGHENGVWNVEGNREVHIIVNGKKAKVQIMEMKVEENGFSCSICGEDYDMSKDMIENLSKEENRKLNAMKELLKSYSSTSFNEKSKPSSSSSSSYPIETVSLETKDDKILFGKCKTCMIKCMINCMIKCMIN